MQKLYNPGTGEVVELGRVLAVLGASLESSGVGIVIARPITQRRAGGFVLIVTKGATGRNSAIRRRMKWRGPKQPRP